MIRKLFFFILYYIGAPAILRRYLVQDKAIPVILFHRISNHSDKLWPAMPVKSFEKLIIKLKQSVEIISFSDLNSIKTYPLKPMVILSFDDGYSDFYEVVMPFFKANKIKANHNICPGLIELAAPPWTQILSLYLSYRKSENNNFNQELSIPENESYDEKKFIDLCKKLLLYKDKERNELIFPLLKDIPPHKLYTLMNWDQINYCVQNNIEIGSHGNLHRNLLQITEQHILENEIDESGKKIEIETGKRPLIFAFANAVGSAESKEFVKKSGYKFALIAMDKLYQWRPNIKDEILEIPRINISRSDWREEYLRALGFHTRIKQLFNIN